ncbi:MAG: AsmA-like C-terminal region-containing protein [Chitinophagales bacterium]
MRKWLKALVAFLLVIITLFIGALLYVQFNQQKILARVQKELKKNINGELSIDKISFTFFSEFPNLSLTIIHPVIKDSLHHKEVFSADKIFFRLGTLNLLRGKIDARSLIVENGFFHIKQDSSGYSNEHIFRVPKSDKKTNSDINFEMDYLELNNLKFIFDDEKRNRHFSLVGRYLNGNVGKGDSTWQIPLAGWVHMDSLFFRADRGAFFLNRDVHLDMKMEFDAKAMQLNIFPSSIQVDGQDYQMRGAFIFTQTPALFRLTITNPKTDFDKARLVLSDTIQSYITNIHVKDPVEVEVFVRGEIDPVLPPQVDAGFKLRNAHISAYGVEMDSVYLDGLFINHVKPDIPNEDNNSSIAFNVSYARVNGIPVRAVVSVTDLWKLFLDLQFSTTCNLTAFNSFIPSQKYRFTTGVADVNVSYKGSLNYYLDSVKRKHDDTLSGKVRLVKGGFVYDKRRISLSDMNADIDLGLNKIGVNNLSASLNGNLISLNGNVTSLRKIFQANEQKMVGNFNLDVPQFDLSKVLTVNEGKAVTPQKADPNEAKKIAATIDMLTDKLTATINFSNRRFKFSKFEADNVSGVFTLSSKGMLLDKFKMNACKGSVELNGGLNAGVKNDYLTANVRVKNVDIKSFFAAAENFKQDAITDKNLGGLFSVDLNFSSELDELYTPILDSIDAVGHFSLKQGRITDFAPIMDVGKSIFKKRDFANISFAEIHDTLKLKNGKLFFERMEISSSVMRVFVIGYYAFKGETDMVIQFPLSNLKKQDADYKPENIGLDARIGPNVVVRVHGINNKMKTTLDPIALKRLEKLQDDF